MDNRLHENCALCHPSAGVVERGEYWTIVLNENQALLGRCYLALNRHETDVTSLTPAEQLALFQGLKRLKSALSTLLSPEHFNYVSLNNVAPHVHFHIIPRYAGGREFDGARYVDGHLGAHYDPAAEKPMDIAGCKALAERIRTALPPLEPLGIERGEIDGAAIKRGQLDRKA